MSDMADVVRRELAKGSYQMPGDTLPYETQAARIAAALSAAGFGPVQEARAVPNAHDTTHVVKVVCNYCDHLGYQKVKLGQPIEHECSNSPIMDPIVSVTICAWEYETRTRNDDQ